MMMYYDVVSVIFICRIIGLSRPVASAYTSPVAIRMSVIFVQRRLQVLTSALLLSEKLKKSHNTGFLSRQLELCYSET